MTIKNKIMLVIMVVLVSACVAKATPYLWKSYTGPALPYISSSAGVTKLNNAFTLVAEDGSVYNGFEINEGGVTFYPQQFLRKLSSDGVELWRLPWPGKLGLTAQLVPDGILVADGRLEEPGPFIVQHHISKISAEGTVQWTFILGENDTALYGMAHKAGISYLVYTTPTADYYNRSVRVAAVDAAGKLLWSNLLDFLPPYVSGPLGIATLPDDRLLVAVSIDGEAYSLTMTKDGDILDQQHIGPAMYSTADNHLRQLGEQIFLITPSLLASLNDTGSLQWSHAFTYDATCSLPTADGIACFHYSYDGQMGNHDIEWFAPDGTPAHSMTVTWTPSFIASNGQGKWVVKESVMPDVIQGKRQIKQFYDSFHVFNSSGIRQKTITTNPGLMLSVPGILWEPEWKWSTIFIGDVAEQIAVQDNRLVVSGRWSDHEGRSLNSNRIYTSAYSLD